jgi:hypothetical protein
MLARFPIAVPVALALSAATLGAQQPTTAHDAQLHASCRLATQILNTGQPDPHRSWALSIVVQCADSGPLALIAAWQTTTEPDRSALALLVGQTERLRDQRLADAIMDLAADPARPRVVRLSSLRVLASYFQPGKTVTLETLKDPPGLARSDQDEQIRAAARFLLDNFEATARRD